MDIFSIDDSDEMSVHTVADAVTDYKDIALPHRYSARIYQKPLWKAMFQDGIRRAILVWHRRAGKDKTVWNVFIQKTQEKVGAYYYMLPKQRQARKVIWDGRGKDYIDENGVKQKGVSFREHIPEELIANENATEMKITLTNGSIIQLCGSDNYDSLMGTNPLGIVFSEYSIQNPAAWDYFRPILAENDGFALFVYTTRGLNHGYTLFNKNKNNDKWLVSLLTVDQTKLEDGSPVITEEAIQDDRDSGMDEAMIQQEYYCDWNAANKGAIFGKEMAKAWAEKRVCRLPIDPLLPVYTCWDIGYGDATVIWFIQIYGKEIRCVNMFYDNNQDIAHYAKYIRKFKEENNIEYHTHYGPHDLEKHESNGQTIRNQYKEAGIKFKVVPRVDLKINSINALRKIFPQLWFDEERCLRGIEALSQYQWEYNEEKHIWKSDKPYHDWSSDFADALQQFAMGYKDTSYKPRSKQYRRGGANSWMGA